MRSPQGLPLIQPHAAGADIGAQAIQICIPGPDNTQIVRTFGVYIADLQAAARWLLDSGKIIRSSTGKSHNRARQAFLQAAASLARSNCAFGAFYRRLRARIGPAQAQVATAHKIARVVYRLLKFKVPYQTLSAQQYEQAYRQRDMRHLQRKAARLGLSLVPLPAAIAVS